MSNFDTFVIENSLRTDPKPLIIKLDAVFGNVSNPENITTNPSEANGELILLLKMMPHNHCFISTHDWDVF